MTSTTKWSPKSKTNHIEQDDLFYSESIVLKVENTLFSVPKKGLAVQGTFFERLFLDRSDASELELIENSKGDSTKRSMQNAGLGCSNKNPIVLRGVGKAEFRDFLRVIFPFRYVDRPQTEEQWVNILHLAHMWNFSEIKTEVVSNIGFLMNEERDPFRAVVFCKKYSLEEHLIRSYKTVITARVPLQREGMVKAGMDEETISFLTTLRDTWLTRHLWGGTGSGSVAEQCLDQGEKEEDDEEKDPFRRGATRFIKQYIAELEAKRDADASNDHDSGEIIDAHQTTSEEEDHEGQHVVADEMAGTYDNMEADQDEDSGHEEPGDSDGDDEDETKVLSLAQRIVLQDMFDWFADYLDTPPQVKKLGMIDEEDLVRCVLDFIHEGTKTMLDGVDAVCEIFFQNTVSSAFCARAIASICKDVIEALEGTGALVEERRVARYFRTCIYSALDEKFRDRVSCMEEDDDGDIFKTKEGRLALIRFIGELFMVNILHRPPMERYIQTMLHNIEKNQDIIDVESLCYLLALIGKRLDLPSAVPHTCKYFSRIRSLMEGPNSIPKDQRKMLQEVVQLRDRRWEAPGELIGVWVENNADRKLKQDGVAKVRGSGGVPQREDDVSDDESDDESYVIEEETAEDTLRSLFGFFAPYTMRNSQAKYAGTIGVVDVFLNAKEHIITHPMACALERVAKSIFANALAHPSHSHLHAEICTLLAKEFEGINIKSMFQHSGGTYFTRQLFRCCRGDFSTRVSDTELANSDQRGGSKRENRAYAKRSRLALIKFMGELFMVDIIYRRTMSGYIEDMLDNIQECHDVLDIECLCYLLALIGETFDTASATAFTDVHFDRIRCLTYVEAIPERLRNMLKEVDQLRDRNWESPSNTICKWLQQ